MRDLTKWTFPARNHRHLLFRRIGVLDRQAAQTTVQEIGHIIAGNGHPDQDDGPAPLQGTDRKQRLLHSGDGLNREFGDSTIRTARGHRLVKKEWDAAEIWLNENLDKEIP